MSWNTDNAIEGVVIVLMIVGALTLIMTFVLIPGPAKAVLGGILGTLSLGFIIGGLRK